MIEIPVPPNTCTPRHIAPINRAMDRAMNKYEVSEYGITSGPGGVLDDEQRIRIYGEGAPALAEFVLLAAAAVVQYEPELKPDTARKTRRLRSENRTQ
jgi:hypothetical protein